MRLGQYKEPTKVKKPNRTYVIGNAERERELEKELAKANEELRSLRPLKEENERLIERNRGLGNELTTTRNQLKTLNRLRERVGELETELKKLTKKETEE